MIGHKKYEIYKSSLFVFTYEGICNLTGFQNAWNRGLPVKFYNLFSNWHQVTSAHQNVDLNYDKIYIIVPYSLKKTVRKLLLIDIIESRVKVKWEI